MNIRIQITPELRVRLAHSDFLIVELPPEISTALEGREELMKSLTAADVPTDSEALRVERDQLSAKCDALAAQVESLKSAALNAIRHWKSSNDVYGAMTGLWKVCESAPQHLLAAHDAEVGAQAIEKAAVYMMGYLGLDPNITSVSVIALREYAAQLIAKAGE